MQVNILAKFCEDCAKNMASRVSTSKLLTAHDGHITNRIAHHEYMRAKNSEKIALQFFWHEGNHFILITVRDATVFTKPNNVASF